MLLVEQHIIKKSHIFYKECDSLCFKSKNLYNKALYNIRQHYFNTNSYLSYKQNYYNLRYQTDYQQLPDKVSKQTLRLIDKNFISYFNALKSYNKNKNKFKTRPQLPNYLPVIEGRFITRYEKDTISIKEFKKTGLIKLSKTNIFINTQIKDIKFIHEVRIIPRNSYYTIEVVYDKPILTKSTSTLVASIDPGLNNLMTVTFSDGKQPIIFNGRPLKGINQYYNKKKAEYQSQLPKGIYKSNKITQLTNKRNNKIKDYLHKTSKMLVNLLASKDVGTTVFGWNQGIKQDSNMGNVNNQNFASIPYYKLRQMISYKTMLEGITYIEQEESYTSKCSFLDDEHILKQTFYKGKRVKRGIFESSKGVMINADVNGSYNIMKKAFPKIMDKFVTLDGIEGVSVHPMKLNTY